MIDQPVSNIIVPTVDIVRIRSVIELSIEGNRPVMFVGVSGTGKTTIAKNVATFTRSVSKIVLSCASTGSANNYHDFYTAHSLLYYPVIEDEILDESEPPQCDFSKSRPFRIIESSQSYYLGRNDEQSQSVVRSGI